VLSINSFQRKINYHLKASFATHIIKLSISIIKQKELETKTIVSISKFYKLQGEISRTNQIDYGLRRT
jgi:hypothetical protein